MFDRLSNDEITNALDELTPCLGVKEEMASKDLVNLLEKKDTEGCVQEIATRLGLPVRVNLSYVPKDFRPDSANRFRSSALTQTDQNGRGKDGITAQVSIPQHLPMFGTSGLQGYPIKVQVSENCLDHPETFIAIMAHELSHVLLASLRSTHKDSDLHADLVPIILGFSDVVRSGRETIETTTSDTIITTTYGYLTDSQFEFACKYVKGILNRHSSNKKRLLTLVEQVHRKLSKVNKILETFRDYFRYLDAHPPERMRKEHTDRLVQLHGQDYSVEWENRITEVRRSVTLAEAFEPPLNHYQPNTIEHLKTHLQVLKAASEELDDVTEAITKDERILRKYVGIIYRLRRTL
ncbi:hypothetical protein ACFL4N_01420 [Thermodesulfobacteriota bacterium]